MKRFAVIGHPSRKRMTTSVLNAIFKEKGVEAEAVTKDVSPEDLEQFIKSIRTGEWDGAIVASPHKGPSVEFMDEYTGSVHGSNALNLIINRGGRLHGHNVNGYGAMHAIQSEYGDLRHVLILIVGAGGAARAAAYRLNKIGAKVAIWNRSPEKAKECAEHLGIEWVEDMRKWNGKPKIIINATGVSRQEKQSTLIPFPLWEEVELAHDAVSSNMSLFLEEAQAAGIKNIVSGDNWFAHQTVELVDRMLKLELSHETPLELLQELEPA